MKAEEVNYGLFFNSFSSLPKDRTSLTLHDGQPISIKNGTSISFDLYPRKDLVFGYVIHLVGNSGEKIVLTFSADEESRFPSLIINGNFYPISNKIDYEKWVSVSLTFSPERDSLYLSYDHIKKSFPLNFKAWDNVLVAFGVCPFEGSMTNESAAINLRNVCINRNKKLVHYWDLKKHNGDVCYDSVRYVPAIATNPKWLIDRHRIWRKVFTKNLNRKNPQYAYDNIRDILYIVPDEKEIIAYSPVANTERIIQVREGFPAGSSTNGLIYDQLNDVLLSYNQDEQSTSVFSFENQTWSKKAPYLEETRYWHHTAVMNEADSSLITFGGYGFYQYKNEIYRIGSDRKEWKKDKLLTIMPRYSAASVIVDNYLYLFGGRGSETGKQEVNPHFVYDLYSVNLSTNETTLLWKTQENPDFLPCGNMIYNPKDSCFYVLSNINNGTLLRFNQYSPKIETVSNGAGESLVADFLFYTAYFSPVQQKIYALFCCNFSEGRSTLSLYEIDFPPLSKSEVQQEVLVDQEEWPYRKVVMSVLFVLLAGAVCLSVFFFLKKKKHFQPVIWNKAWIETEESPVSFMSKELSFSGKKISECEKQQIRLLGAFSITDKEGKDISSAFTPILKNLLLLVILYSEAEENGIKDKKIDLLLWPDKDDNSARNNRNVSLTRLKTLIENIDDIQLLNNKGFWKISFEQNVYCDYHTAIDYMNAYKKGQISPEEIALLLDLLMEGPLLPHIAADWVDKFKSNYSNDAIDILHHLLVSEDLLSKNDLALKITDAIFLFDSLNEEALGIKCYILYHAGKKGLAKTAYDIFIKEYKTLLGEDYRHSLSQVIESAEKYKK